MRYKLVKENKKHNIESNTDNSLSNRSSSSEFDNSEQEQEDQPQQTEEEEENQSLEDQNLEDQNLEDQNLEDQNLEDQSLEDQSLGEEEGEEGDNLETNDNYDDPPPYQPPQQQQQQQQQFENNNIVQYSPLHTTSNIEEVEEKEQEESSAPSITPPKDSSENKNSKVSSELNNNNNNNSDEKNKNNIKKPITEIEMSSFRSSQNVSLLHERKVKTWGTTIKSQIIPNSGDVNAVFSVVLDNLANLSSLVGILTLAYGMPVDLVTRYFIPGPALAVMIGSIALSIYAIYLDYHEKDPSVHYTAIPIGLDAPSTIGLPLLVIGPAYKAALANGMSITDATNNAWLVGCTTVFLIGAFKVVLTILSFAQKQFHPVGKAGALAGIGLSLLGLNELLTVVEEPVVGWVSLWLLLLILMHRQNKHGETVGISLPFNISGVLVSALVGAAIYYFMAGIKISVQEMPTGVLDNYELDYPHPSNIFKAFTSAIKQNISIAIPYAILVNIGSLTISDSANNVGNAYNTRAVLLIDSISTIIGSFFGATVQTTPYIGHTVFHTNFKARSGYSIISGLLIGCGGFFGYIGLLTKVLPKPAIIPIFIFIAFEICNDTLHNANGIKPHHSPAVIWSFFPSLFQFTNIILSQISPLLAYAIVDPSKVIAALPGVASALPTVGNIMIMAHGFICTALFWGTSLAYILDNRLKKASIFLAITGVLTFFGVIHSVNPNGEVYVPWNSGSYLPYHWTAAYFLIALITFAFSFIKAKPVNYTITDDLNNIQARDFNSKPF